MMSIFNLLSLGRKLWHVSKQDVFRNTTDPLRYITMLSCIWVVTDDFAQSVCNIQSLFRNDTSTQFLKRFTPFMFAGVW